MTWICETCDRSFARKGQSHSCNQHSFEANFSGVKTKWIPLYRELLDGAREKLGDFTEYYPSVGVMWKHSSAFAEVKCKKDCMEVVFYSDRLQTDRNPIKHLQTSVNRVVHAVAVTDNSNMEEILEWIEESYHLTKR